MGGIILCILVQEGCTALHYAASFARVTVLEVLGSNGAQVELKVPAGPCRALRCNQTIVQDNHGRTASDIVLAIGPF